jgi:hypothetical protein
LADWPKLPDRIKPLTRSHIAILGTAGSIYEAPVKDNDVEMWGITQIYRMHPDFRGTMADERTRWFEIHGKSKWEHEGLQDYYRWLEDAAANRFDVYVKYDQPEAMKHVPHAKELPRKEIFAYYEKLTGEPVPYIMCTCSWQLAMAIMMLNPNPDEGPVSGATISIWGIDMMVADATFGQEYSYQRPSVEYFVGIAQGMGIKTIIPDTCDILKCIYPYGDKDDNPIRARIKARAEQLNKQTKQMQKQAQAMMQRATYCKGGYEMAEWILRSHFPGEEGYELGTTPEQFSNVVPKQLGGGGGQVQAGKGEVQVSQEAMQKIQEIVKADAMRNVAKRNSS